MTPEQTQELLQLITALWPRHPLTADAIDAWANALAPIDANIAKTAVLDHSRSREGEWPPSIAVIAAAARAADRGKRPADQTIATIDAQAAIAARDHAEHKRRVARVSKQLGTEKWTYQLEVARQQLIAEYKTNHIPEYLTAARACDLATQTTAE